MLGRIFKPVLDTKEEQAVNYTKPVTMYTPILSGRGTIAQLPDKIKEFSSSKALLLTDVGVVKAGICKKIEKLLKGAGISYVVNDTVLPDPPDYRVDEIVEFARAEGIDSVIALGGGSTMDTGKCVSLMIANGGLTAQWLNNFFAPQKPGIPLICIPTTSGTGAEVSPGGVITDTAHSTKGIVAGAGCVPAFAIVDGELCVGVPPRTTASTAFDVLAHAIDGIVAIGTSGVNQAVCVQAISLFLDNLYECVYNGSNADARHNMHVAANLGGISLANAAGSGSHAFGHALGAMFHIQHGICVGIFTPACLEWYAKIIPDEVLMCANALRIKYRPEDSIEEVAAKTARFLVGLMKSVDLPLIKECVPDKEECYKIIPVAVRDTQAMNLPRMIMEREAKWIIDKAYSYCE